MMNAIIGTRKVITAKTTNFFIREEKIVPLDNTRIIYSNIC